MKIPLVDGRDFRPEDVEPDVAIVNQAFAREYFGGANPIGRWFGRGTASMQVVGVVRDARYRNMREPITPTVYIPFRSRNDRAAGQATILVRTAISNPLAVAGMLRKEVPRARAEFRVSNIRTQEEINRSQTVRERLLAKLALFFAAIAVLLAAIGIFGVLDYSVLQRSREIGIRMAVGARASRVATLVVWDVFAMVACGTVFGSGLGLAIARYVDALLYGVKPTEPGVLVGPALIMLAAAALAAIAPAARAVSIDPVAALKVD
jgi:hypothetical protein